MFISCPHCRDLVATDPQTRLPPAMCSRCGGDLLDPTGTLPAGDPAAPADKRSFASFLQHEPQAVAGGPMTGSAPIAEEDTRSIDAEDSRAQDNEPTPADQDSTPMEAADATKDVRAAPEAVASVEPRVPLDSGIADSLPPSTALPRFTRATARPGTHRPVPKWQIALLGALGLLLGLQILIADRARLAADAGWRPVIERLCSTLGCAVPAWHQPGAFTMLNRDVRPIANLPGGLEAQATFRNDAEWPQAWPLLLLSLSDADGRVVGTRYFTPADYLGKDVSPAQLAPGQSAQVTFRLREPDAGVVAFAFDFR